MKEAASVLGEPLVVMFGVRYKNNWAFDDIFKAMDLALLEVRLIFMS